MTTKIYSLRILKFALLIFFVLFSNFGFAQTAPDNTRFIQQNTLKGSRISLVETTDNYVYHIGKVNSSEFGIDNLTVNNTGLDDFFVLKSSASSGTNSWMKTFHAGAKGTIYPRNVYVDSSENIYVFAQFKGTLTVGSKTISSVNLTDAFLMKIDSNGNALWVDYLENGYNTLYKTKCITDGTDTFFVYGGNHLLRLNDSNGNVIYDNVYSSVELKSITLRNNDLYLAGYARTSNIALGSEVITYPNTGFVLKGDKNANFLASLKTSSTDPAYLASDISDITISSDGFLLLSGFYNNKAINLITETGTVPFTYNPNSTYNNSRLYNYVAKVDFNLANVSFFRSSSAINQEGGYNVLTYRNSSRLVAYGNSGNFHNILYITDRFKTFTGYTNTNGSTTNFTINPNVDEYTLLTSNDSNGAYQSGAQPVNYGIRTSTSGNLYTQVNNNVRIFISNTYNSQSTNLLWSKQKASSVGGTYTNAFIKHLNSAKSDLFLTTLVEGKADFFGTQINNGTGNYTRYFTRLGADGIAKWIAKFDSASNVDKVNVSQNYAVVDKDDNLYVLCGKSANTSVLTDATGSTYSFGQTGDFLDKVLIKLDKNGKLVWSKQISGCDLSALAVDANNNLYITGISGSILLDGNYISGNNYSLFILKFTSAGSLTYSKLYDNLMNAYSINPVFDAQNNFYIFSEPQNFIGNNYHFDNIEIPVSQNFTDLIMVKFDTNGNAVFGKNFYKNSTEIRYAWPNDVQFDGENFVMMGNMLGYSEISSYLGLDLVDIPKIYPQSIYATFFAKIKTDGSVIWQKVLESNNSNAGNYTNINVDENKNTYMYYYVKDKVSVNGTEYSFDANKGNKILLKLNTSGALNYIKAVDFTAISYPMIDVFGVDKFNVMGLTLENNILNYPVKNANASNLYVATFGALDQKYLTPISNYLLLTNATISNNPGNANSFVFDLVNNVNWTATSDQNWLNLSASQVKNTANTISGTGDAKLTLTAETNNSGSTRSSGVLISGDGGVASKTVIVTQTGILANQEARTFVTVIYPNPTSDILNIQTDQKISKIEIYDTSGKLLKSNFGNEKSIRVSELAKGLYLIKIYSDQLVINSKFIKN